MTKIYNNSKRRTVMNMRETGPELESRIYTALKTYSNVHRGSGHFSLITTGLFDHARDIVLAHLGLDRKRHVVIFCTPRRAALLKAMIKKGPCHVLSSEDLGLPLGVRAVVTTKKALPKGAPFQSGGGTTRLISRRWVLWAGAPDKFEAGTPAIINIIAFAAALQLRKNGLRSNEPGTVEKWTAFDIFYADRLYKYQGQELLEILREHLIGSDVTVPAGKGQVPFINLDNAASTPTFEPVWHAFRHAINQDEEVRKDIVHEVRSLTSQFLNAPLHSYEIIFTSNTTEAINLAAESIGREAHGKNEPVVLGTLLEHTSNDLPWRSLKNHTCLRLPIDGNGLVDAADLETQLREYNQEGRHGSKRIVLVTVCGASNVLGVMNDLEQIAGITHRYGARLLADAAQLVAHRPVDVEQMDIDYLAFSGHKTYAPFGTGVLVARKGLLNFSQAEMSQIRASGEENIGGVAALGKAMLLLRQIGMELIFKEEQALTVRALRGMSRLPDLKLYGITDPDSPLLDRKGGVIAFTVGKTMSDVIAGKLAEMSGIGTRYGCHCAHVLVKHLLGVKPFLESFQRIMLILFPRLRLPGMVRISFGLTNTSQEVDKLLEALEGLSGKGSMNEGKNSATEGGVRKQMERQARAVLERIYKD